MLYIKKGMKIQEPEPAMEHDVVFPGHKDGADIIIKQVPVFVQFRSMVHPAFVPDVMVIFDSFNVFSDLQTIILSFIFEIQVQLHLKGRSRVSWNNGGHFSLIQRPLGFPTSDSAGLFLQREDRLKT
jgi:hypothetical protein